MHIHCYIDCLNCVVLLDVANVLTSECGVVVCDISMWCGAVVVLI